MLVRLRLPDNPLPWTGALNQGGVDSPAYACPHEVRHKYTRNDPSWEAPRNDPLKRPRRGVGKKARKFDSSKCKQIQSKSNSIQFNSIQFNANAIQFKLNSNPIRIQSNSNSIRIQSVGTDRINPIQFTSSSMRPAASLNPPAAADAAPTASVAYEPGKRPKNSHPRARAGPSATTPRPPAKRRAQSWC